MIFKILLSRSLQTLNSDKNWQTCRPLQTFVCKISRHLEFIIEQGHRVAGFPGRWVTKSIVSTESGILREIDFAAIINDFAMAKSRIVSGLIWI